MNETPFAPGTCDKTRNFRFLDKGLADFAAAEGLLLPPGLLARYREICRTVLLRDPTETELRFLDRVFCLFRQMPAGVRVAAIMGADDETAHIWGDICQKAREIGAKAPPTAEELMSLCGKALVRAGIPAQGESPRIGTAAGIAVACGGVAPRLSLTVGNCAAALLPAQSPSVPAAKMLYLLTAADEDRFAEEISAFLGAHRSMGILPLALTGGEGILPHLATGAGLDVDFSLLPGFDPANPSEVLFTAGKRAFLFFAPQNAVPVLASEANPRLVLFGSLTGTRMLTLRAGPQPFCTLPADFFPLLATSAPMALTPKVPQAAPGEVHLTENDRFLLAGVCTGSEVPYSVARCLAALAAHGAELSAVRMGAVLELPPNDARAAATAEALPLLFGYHRTAAELVLPTTEQLAVEDERIAHPRLTVFLCAERKAGAPVPLPEGAVDGVRTGDFGGLRRVLSEKM